MKKKFWVILIAVLIVAFTAGTIAAQNVRIGNSGKGNDEEALDALLAAEGFLVGRIDSHSVEIEIDGEPRVFGLSESLRDRQLAGGVPVRFEFYLDNNNRAIIVNLQELAEDEEKENDMQGEAESGSEQEPGDELSTAGILIGRIDSHSVEIEIDGEPQVFGLSEALRERELPAGPISFKYYVDTNGRPVITAADCAAVEAGTVLTAEGVFTGWADGHTVEVMIGGEARVFGIEAGVSFAGIDEGARLFIAYREDTGRPVIVKIERAD